MRREVTGKTTAPNLERQVDIENCNLSKQEFREGNFNGNKYQGRKTWTVIDEGSVYTNLRNRISRGPSPRDTATLTLVYFQDLYQVSTMNIEETVLWLLA